MSKYCPIIDNRVLYSECLECDTRECRNFYNGDVEKYNKEDGSGKSKSNKSSNKRRR